jgi:hypothetical protein
LVRPPGFEPGFPAISMLEWEAGVIDQAARQRLTKGLKAGSGPRPPKEWSLDKVLVSLTYKVQFRFAGDSGYAGGSMPEPLS